MCVRTKSSYGCGCTSKSTNECNSSRCDGLERYHYMYDGDCKSCKTGGETITRGREGKGRYAQEISQRSPPLAISTTGPRIDVSGGASPWATSARRGDEWHSPTRMKADDAWEEEHETRMSDLQSRAERMSVSAPTSSPRPRRRSPSPEVEDYSDHYYSQDDDRASRHRALVPRTLFGEVKGVRDAHHTRRRPTYADERHESQDSLGALPKLRHSSKSYAYDNRDPYDSGYGSSYDSRRSHRRAHVARTEPNPYSSPSQRQIYELPVSAAPYGYPVGSYGVEIHPSARYLSRW